jgi:hypothetical protein
MPSNAPPFCCMMFLISDAALSLSVTIEGFPPDFNLFGAGVAALKPSKYYAYSLDAGAAQSVQRLRPQ